MACPHAHPLRARKCDRDTHTHLKRRNQHSDIPLTPTPHNVKYADFYSDPGLACSLYVEPEDIEEYVIVQFDPLA